MDWLNQIRNIQIDITSNCNARCPSCVRNSYGGNPIKGLPLTDFDFDVWNRFVSEDLNGKDILSLRFEGIWGDPCVHPQLLEMVDIYTRHHPSTVVTMATNGGGKTAEWWAKLATVLKNQSYFHRIDFNIDGLKDTNGLFRRDIDFDLLMDNLKAFCDAGGNAAWIFQVFDHNKHQIDNAKQLAEDIGCMEFAIRKVFNEITLVDAYDAKYELTASNVKDINYNSWTFKDDSPMVRIHRKLKSARTESPCRWFKHNQIMIDPWGFVWPCIHVSKFTYDDDPMGIIVDDMFDDHGEFNNLKNNKLNEILTHPWYTDIHESAVTGGKWKVCREECSAFGPA